MTPDQLQHIISEVPFDIRAEVLLGELIQNGRIDPEKVMVRPAGIFQRSYKQDIGEVEPLLDEFKDVRKFIFKVFREGLFDIIPEGLFFRQGSREYQKDASTIHDELALQRRAEEAARDFFFPIELEFYRNRIGLENYEREVFSGFSSANGRKIFAREFWNLDLYEIPDDKVTALLYILPYAFQYKGNLGKAREIMESVLRQPITFTQIWSHSFQLGEESAPALDELFLDLNFVLGHSFSDDMPGLLITFEPVPLTEVPQYLPGGTQERLFIILKRFFLPADVFCEIKVEVREEERAFVLNDSAFHGRLGFSSYL